MPPLALIAAALPRAARVLWLVAMALYALLLWRLRRNGLARRYRWFTVFIAFRLARSLALSGIEPNTNLYGWIWLGSAPLGWAAASMAVFEVYSTVLSGFKGVATLSRRVMTGALGTALCLSCLLLAPAHRYAEQYPVLAVFANLERCVTSSLVLFIILICTFLAFYPIPLTRNALVHTLAFSAYFISSTMALLVRLTTGAEATPAINIAMSAITLASLCSWLFLVTPEGEKRRLAATAAGARKAEAHIARLASLNAILGESRGCGRAKSK